MTRHLALVRPATPVAPPTDRWLIAGTPRTAPYPCMCAASRGRCRAHCPCRGRPDWAAQDAWCCARRAMRHLEDQADTGELPAVDDDVRAAEARRLGEREEEPAPT